MYTAIQPGKTLIHIKFKQKVNETNTEVLIDSAIQYLKFVSSSSLRNNETGRVKAYRENSRVNCFTMSPIGTDIIFLSVLSF